MRAESALRSSLGYAFSRSGQREKAVVQYVALRRLGAANGALDLSNLVETSAYLSVSWVYGEALTNLRRRDEAKVVLNETVLLADKLLAKRPSHRPALRAKGAALGVLADIDRRELRFTDALALSRAGLRVQQELTGLDPGNSRSQNNLRVAKWDVFSGVGELGHINEGIASAQAALVIDKVEILSGFSLRNLVPWHSFMASDYAEYGCMGEAQADLAKAEKYLKSFMAVNTAKGAVTALQADLAMARARIDLANNKPDNVEADLAKHIAARLGHCAELGKDAPTGQDGTLADLYLTTADALLMKGDIVNAAAFAQKALLERNDQGMG